MGALGIYLQMTTRMRCQDGRNDGRRCRDRRVCSIRRNVTVLVFFMVVMMLYVDANGGTRKSMHEMRRGASGVMRLTGSTDLSCIRDATIFRESVSMESRVVTVHSGHSTSPGKRELDARSLESTVACGIFECVVGELKLGVFCCVLRGFICHVFVFFFRFVENR